MDKIDHYFSAEPTTPSERSEIQVRVEGVDLNLLTDRGVFSGRQIDKGTAVLIRSMELPGEGRVLDLGCGYGVVGIAAAMRTPGTMVTLVDINARATELAGENCRRAGVSNVEVLTGDVAQVLDDRTFDVILCNPPYRMGKKIVIGILSDAAHRLNPGGSLWIVGRTKQGIKTLARDISHLFATVETVRIKGGYRVVRLGIAG